MHPGRTIASKETWTGSMAIPLPWLSQAGEYTERDSGVASLTLISDTVAPTLVYIFYRLASDPGQVDKLRAEMKGSHSIYDSKALTTLGHLNGVINEALRLHPPVPTGGYRETPPEGLTVAGKFIPGYTTVVAPRYTIGRRQSQSLIWMI